MSYSAQLLKQRAIRALEIQQRELAQKLASEFVPWRKRARPKQLPPDGDWKKWLILAGRGWGKTLSICGYVVDRATENPNARIAIVSTTAKSARDVLVKGPSGILAISPPNFRPVYKESKGLLEWPNGALGFTYTAEAPEILRGPQHTDAVCDELAAWYSLDAWTQLLLGLRLGQNPRVAIATTPRPIPLIIELTGAQDTIVTRGGTRENAANLAPGFVDDMERQYAGTRIGRQELDGEVLTDTPGALWSQDLIDASRVHTAPPLQRIVVAVDPAATSGEGSDETGIVVCGIAENGHIYALADYSGKYTPDGWARVVVRAYEIHGADRVVAETNQGGDMVEHTIRTSAPSIPYRGVRATRGKLTRAEPICAMYEQAKVHHVGILESLEKQMTTWDATSGAKSPDRMDALVWACTDLAFGGKRATIADDYAQFADSMPKRRC